MTRQNFTHKTKGLIRERSGGICEVDRIPAESRRVRYLLLPETCSRPGVDVDHIHPDWAEGPRTVENGAHLCKTCHGIKTVVDNKEAKKAARLGGNSQADKRAANKANGTHRKMGGKPWPKHGERKMQSRPFQYAKDRT